MRYHYTGPLRAPEGAGESAPFDATAAFETNLAGAVEGAEKPREEPVEAAVKEPVEAAEPSTNPEGTESAPAEDDPEVELPNGTEVRKFKLKELNELISQRDKFTQETARATETANKAKADHERAVAAYDGMVKRAQERWAPYAQIDWMTLMRDPNIDSDTFQQIRNDAEQARADLAYLQTEVQGAVQQKSQESQAARVEAAKACITELTDPVKGIKGFGKDLYDKLVGYGRAQGVEDVGQVIDPHLIRLLHKAYQYDQGSTRAEAQVQKVVNNPSKVIKPGAVASTDNKAAERTAKALKALRSTPTDSDAITNAFLASF